MKLDLADDNNITFAQTIADAVVNPGDVINRDEAIRTRVYCVVLAMLDHAWVDDETRNAILTDAANEVGIVVVNSDEDEDED